MMKRTDRASVISRSGSSAEARRAKAEATKQSRTVLRGSGRLPFARNDGLPIELNIVL
jgi:hypothetical protein